MQTIKTHSIASVMSGFYVFVDTTYWLLKVIRNQYYSPVNCQASFCLDQGVPPPPPPPSCEDSYSNNNNNNNNNRATVIICQ